MNIKHLARPNIILTALLCLTIIYAGYAIYAGGVQDQAFTQDNQLYTSISSYLNQGNYIEAQSTASDLQVKYPDNYMLSWYYALGLLGQGQYAEANQAFETTRQLRPFIVTNPQFLAQYGQNLANAGQLPRALKYLERAQQLDPQQANSVAPLIANIKKKLNLK